MRQDMKDLLVDTGRIKGYGKDNRRFHFKNDDADSIPQRINDNFAKHRSKQLGDRIKPLYRFLEKNCGRQWDDIYSEICQVADNRTIRGYHLRQHVNFYVKLTDDNSYYHRPFFVGEDGILYKTKELTRAELNKKYEIRPKSGLPFIKDTEFHWWTKIKGYWYEFTTIKIISTYPEEFLIDRGNNIVEVSRKLHEVVRNKTIKRQVSSKTTKELEIIFNKNPKYISGESKNGI